MGPLPGPPRGGGRGWRDGEPLPSPPQGAGEAGAMGDAESQSLSDL